jgi:hypothetical protein
MRIGSEILISLPFGFLLTYTTFKPRKIVHRIQSNNIVIF